MQIVNSHNSQIYNSFKKIAKTYTMCVLTLTLYGKLLNFSSKCYRALFEDYFSIIWLVLQLSIWFYRNTLTIEKAPWQTDFFFQERFYLRNS